MQPVLKAGSNPSTRDPFIGLVIRTFSKLVLNVSIAFSSLSSVNLLLINLSIDGSINLFSESLRASST